MKIRIILALCAFSSTAMWAQVGGVANSGFQMDVSGDNENPAVTTDLAGDVNVSIDFQVDGAVSDNDGVLGDVGEAIQDGFDRFIDLFTSDDDDGQLPPTGSRSINVTRDNIASATVRMCANLDNTAGTAAETITGAHIHEGRMGENGPVVYSFELQQSNLNAGQNARVCTMQMTTDPAVIDQLIEVRRNPSDYYVNIHSQSNPNGILRAQLQLDDETQMNRFRRDLRVLTDMVREIRDNVNQLDFAAVRDQLNQNAELIAAIARKNGLVADSPIPVGSAR